MHHESLRHDINPAANRMHAVRVDGNDLLAVHQATTAARRLSLEQSCPVLIEAMTYRVGHHSTSDDSTRYRSISEIRHWQSSYDPVQRFRVFLEARGWWDEQQEQLLRDRERLGVLTAIEKAEGKLLPPLSELFADVYHSKPPHLVQQERDLHEHLSKYPEHYSTDRGVH